VTLLGLGSLDEQVPEILIVCVARVGVLEIGFASIVEKFGPEILLGRVARGEETGMGRPKFVEIIGPTVLRIPGWWYGRQGSAFGGLGQPRRHVEGFDKDH